MDWKGISKAAALTARDMGQDALTSMGHGFVDVGEAAVGLGRMIPGAGAGLGWMLDKAGYNPEATHRFLDDYYSPATRQAMDAVENARGVRGTLDALRDNPAAIAYGAARQAPTAIGGAAIGKKAMPLVNKGAQAMAKRKAARQAAAGELMKVTPYTPGIGTDIAATAIGEGIVGTGQGAEEIRQEAPTAPWTAAKSGQAIMRGFGEGIMSAATGFGLRGMPGSNIVRHTVQETAEYPGSKVGENVNREKAWRDYTSPTDMRRI